MKATLTFNLPEEGTEFEACSNGMEYKCKLEEVWESLFRPRHKHGYNNPVINMLLSSESDEDPCHKLMDELEKLYREVMR